jgi:hypothetical protein
MQIDLLYVPECPHRDIVRNLVEQALDQTGRAALIRERQVHSFEDAERLGMLGSPTILIDGQDPFARRAGPIGIACRLYRTDAGLSGVPTLRQLVDALTRGG